MLPVFYLAHYFLWFSPTEIKPSDVPPFMLFAYPDISGRKEDKREEGLHRRWRKKRITGKSIRKNPYGLKSSWFKYCLLIKNTPGYASKVRITNWPDLLLMKFLEIKNWTNFRTRNRTSLKFRKSEIFPTLSKQKKFTFTGMYRRSTGYINNLHFIAALIQDAQNSIFSLKKNILGCQHAW